MIEFICEVISPGLLFVGGLLITVSISVLVIVLFIYSVSPWFVLKSCTFVGICQFLLVCPFHWHTLYFCGVPCNFYFIGLSPPSHPRLFFFLRSLAKDLSILFIFSKNQLLVSWIYAFIFFVSISFNSVVIFTISFFLLTLGFVCSSFSSWFRCEFRLFIWYFSCFLRLECIVINFPLRTALAMFHIFWIIMFSLSIV